MSTAIGGNPAQCVPLCGTVVWRVLAGPVGELVTPLPLPEHTLTVYVSGVTRRSSDGDCLPSLSLS